MMTSGQNYTRAKPDVFVKTYQSNSLKTPGKNFSQLKLKFLLAEQRWHRSFQKFRVKNAHVGVVSCAKRRVVV